MANLNSPTPKKRKSHARYDSLPQALGVIKSQISASVDNIESKESSENEIYVESKVQQNGFQSPFEEDYNDADTVGQIQHKPYLRPKSSTTKHKKSASITGIANRLGFHRTGSAPGKDRPSWNAGNNPDDEDSKRNDSYNLQKYTKKEQEDLISIQTNLKKWIGSEEYLILSQFLDLMDKIAGHVSTQQATEMFDQMDPSNNGQIPTSLLLHDEFLPRMILNLFRKEEDNQSLATDKSLPEDFDLEDEFSTDYENLDSSEYTQKMKEMKQETKRLKQWIIDHGQPAIEKVDELQMMLEVYETERTDKQYELQSFQTRLSKMENLEQALHQTRSTSTLLLQENDSLLLSVHESAKKSEIERKKYNEAIREAAEYKKLSKELQEINDKYNKKNQLLNEKHVSLEEENQNLRQLLLQYETEQTQYIEEYNQEIEVIKNEMKNLQNDLETKNDPHNKNVKWYVSDDDNYPSTGYDSNGDRKRRMTLRNDENDRHTDNELHARDMASEIDNSLTGRGLINGGQGGGGGGNRSRRQTIKMWYNAHVRKASHITLPNEEELNKEELNNNAAYVTDPEEAVPPITFATRQDSTNSNVSTQSAQQTPLWNTKSYEDPALIMLPPPNGMSPLQNGLKQDSAPLLRDGGGFVGSAGHAHEDIFEDAVAQEIKIELRKQIEKELHDDYQLKMQQRDIEYKMELNKEKHEINERERKLKEEYEKQLDELQAKLTEYSKGDGSNNLRVDDMNFDNDEMVLLGGDGGMTNLSSPISDYEIGSEEEKDVFDSDMIEDETTDDQYINNNNNNNHNNNNNNDRPQMNNHNDGDIERRPLIEKDKKSFDDQYVDKVLENRESKKHKKKKKKRKVRVGETVPEEEDLTAIPNPNSDDKCFSCFGLFGGGGI